mmetsp:Transcript_22368/g.22701  ORF Transcript_22368/g.22701 Transcript_22368/m.22701 type:complete len:169 (+) Transcript_22368:86-592(+)
MVSSFSSLSSSSELVDTSIPFPDNNDNDTTIFSDVPDAVCEFVCDGDGPFEEDVGVGVGDLVGDRRRRDRGGGGSLPLPPVGGGRPVFVIGVVVAAVGGGTPEVEEKRSEKATPTCFFDKSGFARLLVEGRSFELDTGGGSTPTSTATADEAVAAAIVPGIGEGHGLE